MSAVLTSPSGQPDTDSAAEFYRQVLLALNASGVPFLVGGAFAVGCYTVVERRTKDLDLFIHGDDYPKVREVLAAAGHETELTHPHWLAKVHAGDTYLDLIFSSGNGVARVDDGWFQHAAEGEVFGVAVKIAPVEETIWSKAFIMERERYDGADIAHLLQAQAERLDWQRLLERFGAHWRVLLSHLVLFGYVYPAERGRLPGWLLERLLERLREEQQAPAPPERACRGTLLSREQYLVDVEQQGYRDGRVAPLGEMSADEVADWTQAIPGRQPAPPADEAASADRGAVAARRGAR